MKKQITLLLSIIVLSTIMAFTYSTTPDFTGTFGVSDNDPCNIELKINNDNTFSFIDYSSKNKKINTTGNWELKNKYIVLISSTPSLKFHNKWKISKNGTIAKSRKGMTYYTLLRKGE